jgi:hypothetical protein
MTTAVTIEMHSGKVTGDTRKDFAEAVNSLPDGWHKVVIEPVRRGYTATRYKYYFGHVLQTILLTCAHHFKVVDGDNMRPARDTAEIHEVLKQRYNGIAIQTPFGIYITSNSTTNLNDRDFIVRFEEAIIQEFQDLPYGCEFMHRDEWAEIMKRK